MRIEIPTNGVKIKDPDIKALYLLDAALQMSTDKMLNANLKFAIEKYHSNGRKKLSKNIRKLNKKP